MKKVKQKIQYHHHLFAALQIIFTREQIFPGKHGYNSTKYSRFICQNFNAVNFSLYGGSRDGAELTGRKFKSLFKESVFFTGFKEV